MAGQTRHLSSELSKLENKLKIFIASDHAGFDSKIKIVQYCKSHFDFDFDMEDLGPVSKDRVDYPDFADKVCQNLKEHPESFGILVCGSGQGMAMRANKYAHIRAALCWNTESATLSREHNAANILCVGARLLDENEIKKIVSAFFFTKFEGGRHQQRVLKISKPTT